MDFKSDTLQICKVKCFNKFKRIHKRQYSRRKRQPPKNKINVIDWNNDLNCPRRYPERTMISPEFELNAKITSTVEKGLRIEPTDGMGRGIFTTQDFKCGSFVATYRGDLITKTVAQQREANNPTEEISYMYYFRHNESLFCYDATAEKDGEFARLINHSKKSPNLLVHKKCVGDKPYLYFTAKIDLPPNTQLLYDYGDRKSQYPWLKT